MVKVVPLRGRLSASGGEGLVGCVEVGAIGVQRDGW